MSERKTSIELNIPDTAVERVDVTNLRAEMEDIHKEIMVEFNKIDKKQKWTYSLRGIIVTYEPTKEK